jgi:hypothetical protein
MKEYKTAVVLNDIAGKDSSTQERERGAELAVRKFISQFIFGKNKNMRSATFFLNKEKFWLQKYIHNIKWHYRKLRQQQKNWQF